MNGEPIVPPSLKRRASCQLAIRFLSCRQTRRSTPYSEPCAVHSRSAMYERFTDRARKVLQLANQEAHRSNDEYIGTEHLLLGILQEGTGTAVATLQTFQVGFQEMTQQIESMIRSSRQTATSSEMPTSREMPPPAKQVIEYAMDEARALAPDSKSDRHRIPAFRAASRERGNCCPGADELSRPPRRRPQRNRQTKCVRTDGQFRSVAVRERDFAICRAGTGATCPSSGPRLGALSVARGQPSQERCMLGRSNFTFNGKLVMASWQLAPRFGPAFGFGLQISVGRCPRIWRATFGRCSERRSGRARRWPRGPRRWPAGLPGRAWQRCGSTAEARTTIRPVPASSAVGWSGPAARGSATAGWFSCPSRRSTGRQSNGCARDDRLRRVRRGPPAPGATTVEGLFACRVRQQGWGPWKPMTSSPMTDSLPAPPHAGPPFCGLPAATKGTVAAGPRPSGRPFRPSRQWPRDFPGGRRDGRGKWRPRRTIPLIQFKSCQFADRRVRNPAARFPTRRRPLGKVLGLDPERLSPDRLEAIALESLERPRQLVGWRARRASFAGTTSGWSHRPRTGPDRARGVEPRRQTPSRSARPAGGRDVPGIAARRRARPRARPGTACRRTWLGTVAT